MRLFKRTPKEEIPDWAAEDLQAMNDLVADAQAMQRVIHLAAMQLVEDSPTKGDRVAPKPMKALREAVKLYGVTLARLETNRAHFRAKHAKWLKEQPPARPWWKRMLRASPEPPAPSPASDSSTPE